MSDAVTPFGAILAFSTPVALMIACTYFSPYNGLSSIIFSSFSGRYAAIALIATLSIIVFIIGCYCSVKPPSITILDPVTKEEALESK
jgi:hypothetical protein